MADCNAAQAAIHKLPPQVLSAISSLLNRESLNAITQASKFCREHFCREMFKAVRFESSRALLTGIIWTFLHWRVDPGMVRVREHIRYVLLLIVNKFF